MADHELELDAFGQGVGLEDLDEGPTDPDEADLPAELVTASLIVRSCSFAETHFGLRVSEMDAPGSPARWGPVHRVHSSGSLHYAHRAADILRPEVDRGNQHGQRISPPRRRQGVEDLTIDHPLLFRAHDVDDR